MSIWEDLANGGHLVGGLLQDLDYDCGPAAPTTIVAVTFDGTTFAVVGSAYTCSAEIGDVGVGGNSEHVSIGHEKWITVATIVGGIRWRFRGPGGSDAELLRASVAVARGEKPR